MTAIDLLVALIVRAFVERAGSAGRLSTSCCCRHLRSRHRLPLLLLLVFRTACRGFRGITWSTVLHRQRRAAATEPAPEASAAFLCERLVLCCDWLHLNLFDLRFGVDLGLRSDRWRRTSGAATAFDCRRALLSSSSRELHCRWLFQLADSAEAQTRATCLAGLCS